MTDKSNIFFPNSYLLNKAVPDNVLSVLKGLAHSLMSVEGIISVVLFGSYAKGTYTPDSDVDIAVFVSDDKNEEQESLYRKAIRIASEYQLDIQILMFADSMLSNPIGIIGEIVEFGINISDIG